MDDRWSCCGALKAEPHRPRDDVEPHEAYLLNKALCVNVLIRHPTDPERCCVVSRKEDRTKYCFPGGKVDPDDWPTPNIRAPMAGPAIVSMACLMGACRETLEESGLIVRPRDLVFVMGSACFDDGRKHNRWAGCYLARTYAGTIGTSEPIDVLWGTFRQVLDGPFGDLYERLLARLRIPAARC